MKTEIADGVEVEENEEVEMRGREHEHAMVGDSSLSETAAMMNREFSLGENQCAEILDWLADIGKLAGKLPQKDYDSSQKLYLFVKILEYAYTHPNKLAIYGLIRAFDLKVCDDIYDHQCPADFCKTIFVNGKHISREAASKAVDVAQEHFGLKPRSDQRSPESRDKMSQARSRQLVAQP